MGDELDKDGNVPGNDFEENPSMSARQVIEPNVRPSNYPANSHASKTADAPPVKKVEAVVSGTVVKRKRPLGKRIVEAFTGDSAKTAGDYVLFEVMIPSAKATFVDAIQETAERMFFGDARNRPRTSGARTPYNQMHAQPKTFNRQNERHTISPRARATHDFDEIVLASRGDGELILERMRGLIDTYDLVTVADFYDLANTQGSGFTDERWGWYSLRDAKVMSIRGGYILDLPMPVEID